MEVSTNTNITTHTTVVTYWFPQKHLITLKLMGVKQLIIMIKGHLLSFSEVGKKRLRRFFGRVWKALRSTLFGCCGSGVEE